MFVCTFEGNRKYQNVQQAFQELQSKFDIVKFSDETNVVPWFPRDRNDLQYIGQDLMRVEEDNCKDSLQFTDTEYRKRRDYIAQVSKSHILGQPIPILEYTEQENQTWRTIYNKLSSYHKDLCTDRYNYNKRQLERELGIQNQIPQLRDLDAYLRQKTNFKIKAAHGILSQREFLNALAHRVFFSTQYIRHHKTVEYTPEPDIVHEVVGHIPMFADPVVADISQEIGLLSIGANDEQLRRLGNIYWFTLEFGACKENGKMKAYGAGIIGCIGECEHFLSQNSRFKYLDPFKDCDREYPIQKVQPVYCYTNSFEECLERLVKFGEQMKKPMKTWYDFNTETIECDRRIIATDKYQ
ncbi:biopterin-dependent aromatic amino acid hydroxylase (macronuclear) [Tetrahymena thermophila SB210]|uniref:phenylalanine 4-monooxygenase n=1 Tax=Tetrahymena thermophila (strain SB210) TaxID=312017 RepID=Q23A76_TETTS|nr:biopterin-dependent aromatic amino acid hydroxylase [Tetrahymena thermophila SB210]EAR93404.2 biopterin-dependent aromatic amino acid hydroxylase [Tetrahymena thermophila SB210]|eukprot:XP_001013649.2 biopterin-dependent aromatic amino acid hydroxylase [Tetrahymena thermophila SB210]